MNCKSPRDWHWRSVGRWLAIAVCLCSVAVSNCNSADSPNLIVNISLVDSIPRPQKVLVALRLTNCGDSAIVLYARNRKIQPSMGGILSFDIVFNRADTLVCRPAGAIPKYPVEGDTIVLSAGETHKEIVNLTSYYVDSDLQDTPLFDSTQAIGTRRWPSGEYNVRCRYQYIHRPSYIGGRDLWQGSAVSNTISVAVPE